MPGWIDGRENYHAHDRAGQVVTIIYRKKKPGDEGLLQTFFSVPASMNGSGYWNGSTMDHLEETK